MESWGVDQEHWLKTLQQPSPHLFEMMLDELEASSAMKVTIATTKSKPAPDYTDLSSYTNCLAEDTCPFPGINTISFSLYHSTHNVKNLVKNYKTLKGKKTTVKRQRVNQTRLRNDAVVETIRQGLLNSHDLYVTNTSRKEGPRA